MPEKCQPCTWTILLPMYLDYTDALSNKPLQRSAVASAHLLPVPLAPADRHVRRLQTPRLARTMNQKGGDKSSS